MPKCNQRRAAWTTRRRDTHPGMAEAGGISNKSVANTIGKGVAHRHPADATDGESPTRRGCQLLRRLNRLRRQDRLT